MNFVSNHFLFSPMHFLLSFINVIYSMGEKRERERKYYSSFLFFFFSLSLAVSLSICWIKWAYSSSFSFLWAHRHVWDDFHLKRTARKTLIFLLLVFSAKSNHIQNEMVSILLPFLIFLIGSTMAFMPNGLTYSKSYQRISRQHEQQNRALRNIMGKLFDTETNTIYNLDGQKNQGIPLNSAASMAVGPSTRFIEDLACLEACYKCVEDYPQTAVSSSLCACRLHFFYDDV